MNRVRVASKKSRVECKRKSWSDRILKSKESGHESEG